MTPQANIEAVVNAHIQWAGHDCFIIKSGELVIYIDPFQLNKGLPQADIILITHDHYDHCSPSDIAAIQKSDTKILCPPESKAKLSGKIHTISAGASAEIKGIKIETVPAYNIDKKFHPQANKWMGYIITVDGSRIYHAGDTDFIPEMKNFKCDIAIIPVSGTYVMTAKEAVEASKVIDAKVFIPMHYGSIVGGDADAEYFRKNCPKKVMILSK